MTKTKKWLLILGILVVIGAIGDFIKGDKDKKTKPLEVAEVEAPKSYVERFNQKHFNEISGVYKPIRNYLRKNLNDPSSLEVVNTWNLGMNKDSTFSTKTTFRAKNSFNALVMQAIYCNIDFEGNLSEVRVE